MEIRPTLFSLLLFFPLLTHGWVKEMENDGLYQGDMILSPEQQEAVRKGDNTFGSIKTNLWPGPIPYSLSPSLSRSSKAVNAIQLAIDDYHKYTCLRFVKRTTETAYIYFYNGQGCSSPVGRTGRRNTISLSSGCWARSTVIHEIGHSIGFHHEQSRPDRDSYLKIHWENIPDRLEYNFRKQPKSRIDSLGTSYDYFSNMHYGKTAFGSGKVTMETTDAYYTDLIGTGSGFSEVDIIQVNLLYKCPPYKGPYPVKPTPECHDGTSYCEMFALDGKCSQSYYKNRCPISCGVCSPDGSTRPPPKTVDPSMTVPTLPPTQPPTFNPNCKDTVVNCKENKAFCRTSGWVDFMKKRCAKTCGYCSGPPPTDCKDRANNCQQIIDSNQAKCSDYYMKAVCKKTCNSC